MVQLEFEYGSQEADDIHVNIICPYNIVCDDPIFEISTLGSNSNNKIKLIKSNNKTNFRSRINYSTINTEKISKSNDIIKYNLFILFANINKVKESVIYIV